MATLTQWNMENCPSI